VLAVVLAGLVPSAGAATSVVSDTPDSTPSFNGAVHVVQYHRGVAYLGGEFTLAVQDGITYQRRHLAAVDAATGDLLPWSPRANGTVRSLRVGTGWTYLGGAFTRVQGASHVGLARVATASGRVDRTFKPRVPGEVRALAVFHRTLYAGGTFLRANGHVRKHLAAFRPRTGALVSSWRPQTDGGVNAIQAAHRRLYVAGGFQHLNGSTRGRNVAPLGPVRGTLQSGYRSTVGYVVNDIEVTASRIYAAADGPAGHVRALSLKGAGRWNLTVDGGTRAITLLGGTLYVGGHFDNACTTAKPGVRGGCLTGTATRHKLLAASAGDGTLLAWAPQADSASGTFALDSTTSPRRVGAGGAWTALGLEQQFAQSGFAQFR